MSLESVFGLDRSSFGWQHIPDCWSCKRKRSFGELGAKRGFAIACRPCMCASVRPSVTFVDQDHIGCKSWKLIAQTITPTPSLFVTQRPSTYFQGNMGKV